MLYNLLTPLANDVAVLNLFRYLTFRTGAAVLFSLMVTLIIGRAIFDILVVKFNTEIQTSTAASDVWDFIGDASIFGDAYPNGPSIAVGCAFVIDLPDLGGADKIRALGKEVITLVGFGGH